TSTKVPKQSISKVEKRAQILREVNREPEVLRTLLTQVNGVVVEEDLACGPCARKFASKDLRNSVYKHLKTGVHQKSLVREAHRMQVFQPGFETSLLCSRPQLEIPVTRTVDPSTAGDAAKLMLELNIPYRLADDKSREFLVAKCKRPVSTYVIRPRGADI